MRISDWSSDVCSSDLVFQRSLGAGRAAAGLEPQSHYPVQHQCEKTDQRMGADALREPMEYRGDIQIALEHAKAALDVGPALLALNDLRDRKSVGSGRGVSVSVDTGGGGTIKKKNKKKK